MTNKRLIKTLFRSIIKLARKFDDNPRAKALVFRKHRPIVYQDAPSYYYGQVLDKLFDGTQNFHPYTNIKKTLFQQLVRDEFRDTNNEFHLPDRVEVSFRVIKRFSKLWSYYVSFSFNNAKMDNIPMKEFLKPDNESHKLSVDTHVDKMNQVNASTDKKIDSQSNALFPLHAQLTTDIKPGTILLAHPLIHEQLRKAVVLILAYNEEDAYGLIINRPRPVKIDKVLGNMPQKFMKVFQNVQVCYGGKGLRTQIIHKITDCGVNPLPSFHVSTQPSAAAAAATTSTTTTTTTTTTNTKARTIENKVHDNNNMTNDDDDDISKSESISYNAYKSKLWYYGIYLEKLYAKYDKVHEQKDIWQSIEKDMKLYLGCCVWKTKSLMSEIHNRQWISIQTNVEELYNEIDNQYIAFIQKEKAQKMMEREEAELRGKQSLSDLEKILYVPPYTATTAEDTTTIIATANGTTTAIGNETSTSNTDTPTEVISKNDSKTVTKSNDISSDDNSSTQSIASIQKKIISNDNNNVNKLVKDDEEEENVDNSDDNDDDDDDEIDYDHKQDFGYTIWKTILSNLSSSQIDGDVSLYGDIPTWIDSQGVPSIDYYDDDQIAALSPSSLSSFNTSIFPTPTPSHHPVE